MRFFVTFLIAFSVIIGNSQNIIPFPNQCEVMEGDVNIPSEITISTNHDHFKSMVPVIVDMARSYYQLKIKIDNKNTYVKLKYNENIKNPEAYKLVIGAQFVKIEAGNPKGCFYALQSLLQLLKNNGNRKKLSCIVIYDQPRFGWRGVMLDESRNFFGVEVVKQILDFMAIHKLNKFHWHLTDVPGWRIEIKKYPLLTSNINGQYYTQNQIKEIIEYANQRFIEIIPEIDMPGHATAAVKAYPEYSGGGSERFPDFTFNPGKNETYEFLTNILREIVKVFPSKYIHIGGDEVHFGNKQWGKLPKVQQLMDREGLNNLIDVEHYFLNRMADSIQNLEKMIIGWDEVVNAELSNKYTIAMWWRHDKPQVLKEAIEKNYKVILCPRIPLYFDFVQNERHIHGRKWNGNFVPIDSVYCFPNNSYTGGVRINNSLVKGVQGNVWTETIHTKERLYFMLFPRLSALAEVAWTNDDKKSIAGFFGRMNSMMEIYGEKEIHFYDYRNPDIEKEVVGPKK